MRCINAPVICSLLFFAVCSCSNDVVEPSDDSFDNYLAIDSGITVLLSELRTLEERKLKLDFLSERVYGSLGCRYDIRTRIESNSIHIEFLGIYALGSIETLCGPATGSFIIGAPPNGSYDLFFYVNGDVEQVILDVTDEAYSLNIQHCEWCSFPHTMLLRIPEGTIWGIAEYLNSQYESLIDSYIDTLGTVGAEEMSITPGFYGEFTIDSTGTILLYGRTPENGLAYFYHYQGDWDILADILRYYASTSENAVRIWVMGTGGQWLQSWNLVQDP